MNGSGNKADGSSARKQDNKETDRLHASDREESTSGTKEGAIGTLVVGIFLALLLIGMIGINLFYEPAPPRCDTTTVQFDTIWIAGYVAFCVAGIAYGFYYSFRGNRVN